jgi:ABC-type branched-subunit amino acid transport system permease subunit
MPDRSTDPPVDPRGPRFAAWVTTAVLVAVVLTGSAWLAWAQAAVFAIGAFAGLRYSPYPAFFRAVVAPRLRPPTEREPAAPVRFAQGVGFAFTLVAALGFALGLPALGLAAAAFALAAAALNAVFGVCLGCEVYLRLPTRLRHAPARPQIS